MFACCGWRCGAIAPEIRWKGASVLKAGSHMADLTPRIWQVGALCRAVADALDARFNPVAVRGEITGLARAASGHCYFSIKDESGQLRCVMFKRAAGLLGFPPRDGELVEVRGRLALYEPRGDLQMIVESMARAGQGALFEQFLALKAKLAAEGLFDTVRKRALPLMPRGIGVVTSMGAAALRDVISALQRRVPHIPVVVAAASVQGGNAPAELASALASLYQLASPATERRSGAVRKSTRPTAPTPMLDVILLVRGGGSVEDLWAFNDESLARAIARSPVPIVCGVGHETDFTIADFVADLRAPTPTAAAELVSQPRDVWLGVISAIDTRLTGTLNRRLDTDTQRLDSAAAGLSRRSAVVGVQRRALRSGAERLRLSAHVLLKHKGEALTRLQRDLPSRLQIGLERSRVRLARAELRLDLLDPSLVLQRGFAWLADEQGRAITSPKQTRVGQSVRATLAGGQLDLLVAARP